MTATVGTREHRFQAELDAPGTGITNGTAERPFADANGFPFTEAYTMDPADMGAGTVGTAESPFLITGGAVPPDLNGFNDGFSNGFGLGV